MYGTTEDYMEPANKYIEGDVDFDLLETSIITAKSTRNALVRQPMGGGNLREE